MTDAITTPTWRETTLKYPAACVYCGQPLRTGRLARYVTVATADPNRPAWKFAHVFCWAAPKDGTA